MTINSGLNFKKIALIALAIIAGLALIGVIFTYYFVGTYSGVSSGIPPSAQNSTGSTKTSLPNSASTGRYAETVDSSGAPSQITSEVPAVERQMIKTGTLELLVKSADQTAKDMQGIAVRLGGFVSASNVYEVSVGTKTGSVTIRVPAASFNQALDDVKKLAIKVEREEVNAQDVTDQYVDLDSRLRNLQAQEQQYLDILKKAQKIDDILNVTSYLTNVRGQIEQIQGQQKYLSRQVDMASITASLTEEADVQVFGLTWRPLYVIKQAFRDMLGSLQGYVDSMVKLIFALPAVLLWLVTIGLIILVCWKIGRWIWRRFFKPKPTI